MNIPQEHLLVVDKPAGLVVHVGGASTGQRRPEMAVRQVASSKLFYRRHYSRPRVLALEAMISAAAPSCQRPPA